MPTYFFKECVKLLQGASLSKLESDKVSHLFVQRVPMTNWSKIDWSKIERKEAIGDSIDKIMPTLEKLLQRPFDKTVYIEWSEENIPVIKANLDLVIEHFDDVTCVAFDKFIFNLDEGYIIEILHLGNITVGKI